MTYTEQPFAERKVVRTLPRGAESSALGRNFVREQLAGSTPRELDDAMLVATELVTNAIKHGTGEIRLILRWYRDHLGIEVVDEGDGADDVTPRSPGAGGGWGLHIVEALCERWGVFEGTTHVWAEIRLGLG